MDIGTGSGTLLVVEQCSTTDSIGLGGTNPSDALAFDDTELARLIASSSGTLKFQSYHGAIDVNGIVQNTDMQRANHAAVELITDAQKSITLQSSSNSFASLTVTSAGGITGVKPLLVAKLMARFSSASSSKAPSPVK